MSGLRTAFRIVYLITCRPKLALFLGGITSLLLGSLGLFFGIRYVIGDFSKVDLNYPTADFNAIGDYTRVTGNTTSAWGCFYDNNNVCYYVIPKFDDNTEPTYIEQVLVVRIESADSNAWRKLSAATQKRFSHTGIEPATPVRVDGYAHEMNYALKDSAIAYLQSIGFTNADANKTLVPYVVYYDTANKYSTLSFGGVFALLMVICFVAWIAKGMNFRE